MKSAFQVGLQLTDRLAQIALEEFAQAFEGDKRRGKGFVKAGAGEALGE